MMGMCLFYSVPALYFDNIIPDSMGVRKPPWYQGFLMSKAPL